LPAEEVPGSCALVGDAPAALTGRLLAVEGQRLVRRDSVRVTTAFSRLLRVGKGVVVKQVRFEPDRVIVEVALRRRRLICPECGYSTRARKDTRPENSVWRHLDLGVWRLEVHCRRRRLWCPEHGARTEGVPFARPRSEFTRDFECLVAWLATRTDKTTITQVLRIDWGTVGRIIKRVCDDELDADRLNDLYDIGIDEVSWKRQHNYLTLVANHRRGKIVWGCAGKGEKAADAFFAALDPEPAAPSPPPPPRWPASQPREAQAPAITVPFGPCPTVPAGHGIPAAWLTDGCELDPQLVAHASRLTAISIDMTGGYAASARHHAPQAVGCIDPYHVVQVRHEALPVRAGCKTPSLGCRGSPVKLRAV
jgi:transposase